MNADLASAKAAMPLVTPDSSLVRVGVYLTQVALDVLVIALSLLAAAHMTTDRPTGIFNQIAPVILPLFVTMAFYSRAYAFETMRSYRLVVARGLAALIITVTFSFLILFLAKMEGDFPRSLVVVGGIIAVIGLSVTRLVMVWLVTHPLQARFIQKILICDQPDTGAMPGYVRVNAADLGLRPDIDDPLSLHLFSSVVRGYDRVVVDCPPDRREAWALYLQAVGCVGELIIPELKNIGLVHDEPHLGLARIRVSMGPLDLRNRVLKRTLDLMVTVPMIILLTPLFIVVAAAVKLDSRGPVFFRQQRMGRGNRLFDIYKFRSMYDNASDMRGDQSASRGDCRITRVGRFIRATSIDELPQLLNVLQGDMALVGPRPHALGSRAGNDLFWHVDRQYWLRHAIKPGITGLAQVRGYRGATDTRDDLVNRLRSDLEYVRDWTIFRDLGILVRTARVVIHRNAF